MKANKDRRNGQKRRCLSAYEISELERLDGVTNELQEEYDRLYIGYENLRTKHETAFINAKILEQKYLKMDYPTYRREWRKFYEEEITSQELGVTIRRYAENLLNQRNEIRQARDRFIKKRVPC
jgi:hypothetical protein